MATRRGPRGATVERQIEIKSTWTFRLSELRKRLSLPDDAVLHVTVPGGGDMAGEDLAVDDDTPLIATAVEKRMERGDDNEQEETTP